MARRYQIALDVDQRTSALSETALLCRTFNHKWELRAISRKRTLQLLEHGCTEYFRYCERGCGSTWRQVYSFVQGAIIEDERKYPPDGAYLLPKNSGRLDRNAARAATFARQYPGYVR